MEDKCECPIGYFDTNMAICSKCSGTCVSCKYESKLCLSCGEFRVSPPNCDCVDGKPLNSIIFLGRYYDSI
jgi:hypothetical protein